MRNGREYSKEILENFRHNLTYLRGLRGITKKELANRLGYSPSLITALESTKPRKKELGPSLETVAKIARFFGVKPGNMLDAKYRFELFE